MKTLSAWLCIIFLMPVLIISLPCFGQQPSEMRLSWTNAGVIAQTPAFTTMLDYAQDFAGPVIRFGKDGQRQALVITNMESLSPTHLRLTYEPKAPNGAQMHVKQDINLVEQADAWMLTDVFEISADAPINELLEVRRFLGFPAGTGAKVVVPLKSGWAKEITPGDTPMDFEYRLGNAMTETKETELALPVLALPGAGASDAMVATDPWFGTLFRYRSIGGVFETSIHYQYAADKIPLQNPESRTICVWAPKTARQAPLIEKSLDTFFAVMLPDVPAGPKWLHDIAMVHYDYLSNHGEGWECDIDQLTKLLMPSECRRVALCFHGWYDEIGAYCYDAEKGGMKDKWTAMARTRKVPMTKEAVKKKLKYARDHGFRVLMYFADGLLQDSGTPGYKPEWDYTAPDGNKVTGWQGPDTWGPTYARNPANPEVIKRYHDYLAAMLETYGPDVDGFVWDETFYMRTGAYTLFPVPTYCDRAMMWLVKTLTQQVHTYDPEKVFLSSDDVGAPGLGSIPGYAMVADGTYQDSWCHPEAWAPGLFHNWRNTLWSCNWSPFSNFRYTKWGIENFGTPVAISNGWGDDRGPAGWTAQQTDEIMGLFRKRLEMKERVRCLTRDPAELLAKGPDTLLPNDPIPDPAPGEENWALASKGAKVSASSQDDYDGQDWSPAGVIDGVRDDTNWGKGGGWTSKHGKPMPQWVEIELPEPYPIDRFVVITYQSEPYPEKADKWGVRDYDIQVWDENAKTWKTVVEENRDRAMKIRTHVLAEPVTAKNFRILVGKGCTFDDAARLLEVEAWGRKQPAD